MNVYLPKSHWEKCFLVFNEANSKLIVKNRKFCFKLRKLDAVNCRRFSILEKNGLLEMTVFFHFLFEGYEKQSYLGAT